MRKETVDTILQGNAAVVVAATAVAASRVMSPEDKSEKKSFLSYF